MSEPGTQGKGQGWKDRRLCLPYGNDDTLNHHDTGSSPTLIRDTFLDKTGIPPYTVYFFLTLASHPCPQLYHGSHPLTLPNTSFSE